MTPTAPTRSHRTPTYRISVDGRDITPTVEARLMSLTLTETRGGEADQLDLTLSDHDGRLALPRRGVLVTLAMGWSDGPLFDKGSFTVDEAEHSGAPDQITLRARSAPVAGTLGERRDQSWHGKRLGDILRTIAGRNGLDLRVDPALAARAIDHIDQTGESDAAFLSRLATRFDAVATVKMRRLIFLPISAAATADGRPLPALTIRRSDGDSHRYAVTDRDAYTGVRAYWHDGNKADRTGVVAGTKVHPRTLRETYATEAAAREAATSEWQRIQRGLATISLTLAQGRPDLSPQTPVTLAGFKADIDATTWLAVRVAHELGDGGMVTRVEMETRR